MKKRVSNVLAILLVPVLLISPILVGSAVSSSSQEVIKLKFSCPFIEAEPPAVVANHFMDLVEQKTNGRVKFNRFFAETLAKHAEHIQLVGSGSVDLVMVVPAYLGRELVLNQLVDFPFYCSDEKAVALANKLMMEIPETKAIFDKEQKQRNIKILYWNTNGAMELLSKHKATSLADMKGKKINLWAPPDVKIWGEFGMVPVPIFIADFYESLSRGVIDSVYFPPGGSLALKLFEQAKSNLLLHQGDAGTPIIFNLKTWEKLPGDLQEVIMEASRETSQWSVGYNRGIAEHTYKTFKDAGLYVGAVPKEESLKLFEALMKHTTEEFWLGMCKKAGVGDEAEVLLKYWREMAWGR
jgi:TRAP-type C4-dicarboxylate transport system substrate-binding protein